MVFPRTSFYQMNHPFIVGSNISGFFIFIFRNNVACRLEMVSQNALLSKEGATEPVKSLNTNILSKKKITS